MFTLFLIEFADESNTAVSMLVLLIKMPTHVPPDTKGIRIYTYNSNVGL